MTAPLSCLHRTAQVRRNRPLILARSGRIPVHPAVRTPAGWQTPHHQTEGRAIAATDPLRPLLIDLATTLFGDGDDFADVIVQTCRALSTTLDAGVAVFLLDGDELEPAAVTHPSPAAERHLSDLVAAPVDADWLAALPLRTRDVLHLPEVPRPLLMARTPDDTELPDGFVETLIVAPIRDQDGIIGTTWVSRDGPGASFSDDEVTIVESTGQLLGPAVRHARQRSELLSRLTETELELERLDRKLGRSAAVAEQLTRIITGRLRGPVAAMAGLVDLLASHDIDAASRDQITIRLRDRADEASQLLWEFMASSRVNDPVDGQPTSCDLGDVADWVVRLLTPRAQFAGVTLEASAHGSAPIAPRAARDIWLAMADAALARQPPVPVRLLGDVNDVARIGIVIAGGPEPDLTKDSWRHCRAVIDEFDLHAPTTKRTEEGWLLSLTV